MAHATAVHIAKDSVRSTSKATCCLRVAVLLRLAKVTPALSRSTYSHRKSLAGSSKYALRILNDMFKLQIPTYSVPQADKESVGKG